MQLIAIRHTKVNLPPNVCYGKTDVELHPNYKADIENVKKQFKSYNPTKVYSSPLKRCTILAHELSDNIQIDNRIQELNFGDWELQEWEKIKDPYLNDWFNDFYNLPCPNGESMKQLMERTSSFLSTIRNTKQQNIAIVTHSGVIRCIFHIINNVSIKELFNLSIPFGSISTFEL